MGKGKQGAATETDHCLLKTLGAERVMGLVRVGDWVPAQDRKGWEQKGCAGAGGQ